MVENHGLVLESIACVSDSSLALHISRENMLEGEGEEVSSESTRLSPVRAE